MEHGKKTVFVGLSGGVDSSVSALRLVKQGYHVVGVFIKTWHPDFLPCTWEAERLDAMRIAARLNIPFLTCDATDAYKNDVAEYMISEYREGRTPNPDVMCNQYVKFGVFLDFALRHGAEAVATGHYAHVEHTGETYHLYRGFDPEKDQSYFLWTLTQKQLSRIFFPIGDTVKSHVRIEAKQSDIHTFEKRDSQGICFLGHVDIKEFLSHYVRVTKGDVLDEAGNVIGSHDGALFYTLGQRHGFITTTTRAESAPFYVISKDLTRNTITVSTTPKRVIGETVILSRVNVIAGELPTICEAQFRYRQKPFAVQVARHTDGRVMLTVLDKNIETPSLGQSCVLYADRECLGGGIINEIV